MSPPNRQDVPQISKELGIHSSTLYQWRSNWQMQGEVVLFLNYPHKKS
ncbi:helix-turn-helix domain-containing protein [Synechococcus lacustris]|nr:helix-turn-helix domain-containing protein [Synechococcus lacustris Maggiore-St4-Slac]